MSSVVKLAAGVIIRFSFKVRAEDAWAYENIQAFFRAKARSIFEEVTYDGNGAQNGHRPTRVGMCAVGNVINN